MPCPAVIPDRARPIDTLYSFRRCPYAMRVRLALLVGGLPFAIREVALRHKPAAMIAISPKATVPVLVLANGRVIDETIDIMRWSLGRSDPEHWLAGDDAVLIDLFDDRFKHHLDRYKYADRHGTDPLDHRSAGLDLLVLLEKRLSAAANLCGASRSLADMTIMPFVRQFAAVDPDWFDTQPISQVRRWLVDHTASPLFARAMERLSPWQPGDPVILWPRADQPL